MLRATRWSASKATGAGIASAEEKRESQRDPVRGASVHAFDGSADYTLMGVAHANNLFLLSRASSDAYEPYMILKDLGEESLNPLLHGDIPTS